VTFPSTAYTDVLISHELNPYDPENIDYLVLKSTRPCNVYHDYSSTRTAWTKGLIRLRSDTPSVQCDILLMIRDTEPQIDIFNPYTPAEEVAWALSGESPYIDITDEAFGAKGDGATDNATSIQAAIDACYAAGGGVVFIPEGDFHFGTTLALKKYVSLKGTGKGDGTSGGSILQYTGASYGINIDGATDEWGSVLEGFQLLSSTGTYAIHLFDVVSIHVKDLYIKNWPNGGIQFDTTGSKPVISIHVSGCDIETLGNGINIIGVDGYANHATFIGNRIKANTLWNVYGEVKVSGWTFLGNDFETGFAGGVYLEEADALTMHGNWFENYTTGTDGLAIYNGGCGMSIQGNEFAGPQNAVGTGIGIKLGTNNFAIGVVIAGNKFQDWATNISLINTYDVQLGPNRHVDGTALLVNDASHSIHYHKTNVFTPATHWTDDLGEDTTRWRTLYAAELNVWELVARSVVATVGGNIWTADTTKLSVALTAVATTMQVEHNFLASGDRVFLKSLTAFEAMNVASAPSGTGPYTYDIERNQDGTGANAWPAGTAVVNTGQLGEGFIEQYASERPSVAGTTLGPSIVGTIRTGWTWNALGERWAIGNLKGLYDYTSTLYGFAAGDVAETWVAIDTTNGFRVMHGNVAKTQVDASGNASFSGTVTAAAGTIGGFTLGANTLSAGTDADYVALISDGTNAIQIGDSTFDDAKFSVTAAGVMKAVSGTIGGFTLAVNQLSSGSDADYVAMSSAGTNAFWAGDSTFADAPFSVTAAGALKATDATITGSFETSVLEINDTEGILIDLATADSDIDRSIRWGTSGAIINTRDDTIHRLWFRSPIVSTQFSQMNLYHDHITIWSGVTADTPTIHIYGDDIEPGSHAGVDLGTADLPWGETYITPTTTENSHNPLVISGHQILEKVSVYSGTFDPTAMSSIVVENGIIVSVS